LLVSILKPIHFFNMKNLFFITIFIFFSIFCSFAQTQGWFAKCPIRGCKYGSSSEDGSVDYHDCEHRDYRLNFNNINWKFDELLLDPFNGSWIQPIFQNNKKYYRIIYSTKKDKQPRKGFFEASELEKMHVYKFKSKRNCRKFWKGKRNFGRNFKDVYL
jgi:hypothetical protein